MEEEKKFSLKDAAPVLPNRQKMEPFQQGGDLDGASNPCFLKIIEAKNMLARDREGKYEKNQEKIASGSYGSVYLALVKSTGVTVAFKEIKYDRETGITQEALREVTILRGLNHPNIIKLLDVLYASSKVTLVFEYIPYDLS